MTNPASNHPVVCDTCLSPSKLGETTRSLNLPYIGIAEGSDLRQRRMSPSGIVTNPRMKNPMLTPLREAVSIDMLDTLVGMDMEDNIESERREMEENSFDSLLSPSKACDWLSSDPFEMSSSSDKSHDDPRMVKIQPKIKVKSTRHQTAASQGGKSDPKVSTCSDDPSKYLLSPPARNQAAVAVLSNFKPSTTPQFPLKHVSTTPSQVQQLTSMTPPLYSPFLVNQFFPLVP